MRNRTQYVIREKSDQSSTSLLIAFIAGIVFGALGGSVLGSQAAIVRTAAQLLDDARAKTGALKPIVSNR